MTFIAVLHCTVTVESSIISITHTLNWLKWPLACSWVLLFTSVHKCYIWASEMEKGWWIWKKGFILHRVLFPFDMVIIGSINMYTESWSNVCTHITFWNGGECKKKRFLFDFQKWFGFVTIAGNKNDLQKLDI